MYTIDGSRLALMGTGFARQSSTRPISADVLSIIIAFRGRHSRDVFDQFWCAFVAEGVRYYTVKSQRWRYHFNLGIDAYVLKCRSVLHSEARQLEVWGLRADERYEFRSAIEAVMFDEALLNISELDSECARWMCRLFGNKVFS